ncbi:hypothetical protein BGZ67_000784, partial [Mortierella alpina]
MEELKANMEELKEAIVNPIDEVKETIVNPAEEEAIVNPAEEEHYPESHDHGIETVLCSGDDYDYHK